MEQTFTVKHLSIGGQILFIALSALPFWIGIYWLLPFLAKDLPIGLALTLSVITPLVLLFIGALVFGIKESSGGWRGLINRWHLKPMKKRDWGWMFFLWAVYVLSLSLNGLSSSINNQLIGIQPPVEFGLIKTQTTFLGMTIAGNWWVLVAFAGILIVNVFSEDLWFAGILYPKQKLMFGKYAWLVHGISYYLFHMFYPWDVLRLLPCSLAFGWVIYKTENTWSTILAHYLFNGIAMVMTIPQIMG